MYANVPNTVNQEDHYMVRLIAPIGHSRLNLLAAIERVKPDEVLIISSVDNTEIYPQGVRDALEMPKLNIELIMVESVYDDQNVVNCIRQFAKQYPRKDDDVVLISGSTQAVAFTTWMHWGGNDLSVKRGLISVYDNEEINHSFTEAQILSLYQLEIKKGNLWSESNEIFPDSVGFEIDNERGSIVIKWELSEMKSFKGNPYANLTSKMYKITGLANTQASKYGHRTFHHQIDGPKEAKHRILSTEMAKFTFLCDIGGEEE